MKTILLSSTLIFALASMAQATPVTPNVITITSPKVGQAPAVNHFAASGTPFYRISWRTITVNGATVNYLTSFSYSGSQIYTADNVFAATTYAEVQTEATTLGLANLPIDPQAGH